MTPSRKRSSLRHSSLLIIFAFGCSTGQPALRTPAQAWVYTSIEACEQSLGESTKLSHSNIRVEPDGRVMFAGNYTVGRATTAGLAAAAGVDIMTVSGRAALNAAMPAGLAISGNWAPNYVDRVIYCLLRRQFDECERATGQRISVRSLLRTDPDAANQCLGDRFGTR